MRKHRKRRLGVFLCFGVAFALSGLGCGRAQELEVDLGMLGEVKEVCVGGRLLLRDLSLSLIKPCWQGDYGDQRSAETCQAVRGKENGRVVFKGTIQREGKGAEFREEVIQTPEEIRLTYIVTPFTELTLETILLYGSLPCAGHAGSTRWLLWDGERLKRGILPRELPTPYVLCGAQRVVWLAWVANDGTALIFEPGEGLEGMQLQDDRQFKSEQFGLLWLPKMNRTLTPKDSVKFTLRIRAASSALVQEEERKVSEQLKALNIPLTSQEALDLRGVSENEDPVQRYGKFELTVDLKATYDNPFDPEQIDVVATFTSPSGRTFVVPGFFFQDFERFQRNGREQLKRKGSPEWKVRFAPNEVGTWRYTVRVKDRSGEKTSEAQTFTVIESNRPGFVRRSANSPYYLQFDNGQSYFPIGFNVCWARGGGTYDYERWFARLGKAGGNFARIWLVHWNMGLEWAEEESSALSRFHGLGKYSLDNAWRIDRLLEIAEANGIYLMLCQGYHGELMEQRGAFGEQCWDANPYNAKNGGPCQKPADFFTNETARKLYKRRLRYMIARYGFSPQVQSWEFWNEVHIPATWAEEMAKFLKQNDPYQHLITNSTGFVVTGGWQGPEAADAVWKVAEVDFSQTHHYGSGDVHDLSDIIISACRDHTARYGKPHLVGEFGIDWRADDSKYDPKGEAVNLHNGIWASAMSRGMGSAMLWYWDDYVDRLNIWDRITPLVKFARGVDWAKRRFEIARTTTPMTTTGDEKFTDLTIPCASGWGKAPRSEYTVNRDGTVETLPVAQFLYSMAKADLHTTPTFKVNYPAPGKFIVRVHTVSAKGRLQIYVDNQLRLDRELLTGKQGEGEWKESKWMEQWKIYQCVYDKDFEVDVPAGEHVIRVENADGDWISLSYIRLTGYRSSRYPDVRVLGLQDKDFALLWIHNRQHTCFNRQQGKQPDTLSGVEFQLLGLMDGKYRIQWWDTWKGAVLKEEAAVCKEGRLPVKVIDFATDIAAKVFRRN